MDKALKNPVDVGSPFECKSSYSPVSGIPMNKQTLFSNNNDGKGEKLFFPGLY